MAGEGGLGRVSEFSFTRNPNLKLKKNIVFFWGGVGGVGV